MFKLKNTVQEYQWGKKQWLPNFLGKSNPENRPWAELWMGSHPKASSRREDDDSSLEDLINDKGESLLGSKTYNEFGRFPFLFKILAVEEPLSIQVHPSKKQAEEGFLKENNKEIPLLAFNRNYRDDNHKPEIICAVEPYTAMKGFREIHEIKENFKPLLNGFQDTLFKSDDLSDFYFSLMNLSDNDKNKILSLTDDQSLQGLLWDWVRKLKKFYPGDISALAPLFLNLVELKTGEALFLPAGEMHAYLSGVGIELMANSDNVLRGGLTPKYMDLEELKKVVNFEPSQVEILNKKKNDLYPSWVDEFVLGEKYIKKTYELKVDGEAAIAIVFEGKLTIERMGESHNLKKGDVLFIESLRENPVIQGEGHVYWATTGRGKN